MFHNDDLFVCLAYYSYYFCFISALIFTCLRLTCLNRLRQIWSHPNSDHDTNKEHAYRQLTWQAQKVLCVVSSALNHKPPR